MSDAKVVHPEGWMAPAGCVHGLSATGRVIVTSALPGWNPATGQFESDDFAVQAGQALKNIVTLLRAAGADPRHLVRLTWYVTDRFEYARARRAIASAYLQIVGEHQPAVTVVPVAALVEERAKLQIEATAVVPD